MNLPYLKDYLAEMRDIDDLNDEDYVESDSDAEEEEDETD